MTKNGKPFKGHYEISNCKGDNPMHIQNSSEAIKLIKKYEDELSMESSKSISSITMLSDNLGDNWEKEILDKTSYLISINRALNALHHLKKVPDSSCFQVSSLFLKECKDYLTGNSKHNEQMHLVTGTVTEDGIRVLSKMEKIEYTKQSAVYVRGDEGNVHNRIFTLDEKHGHMILAVFHSHTSRGKSATTPSSIDDNFLKRMHSLDIDCISGIFSLDGYVRIYSLKEFTLDVYGKGVEVVEENPKEKILKFS